jgi:D-beta-D-heptose 7-phosphate kinase/D-beta-D-heptose 1-phosphate adenosyltransferase
MGEVLDRGALARRLEEARAAGKKVVFTNGCFDILHRGHVECLRQAKALGDLLIVGLNSDDSVARLKGAGRPVMGQEDRAAVLCALADVDYVCIFNEDTPLELIKALRPDVLVKGGDYKPSEVVGAKEVESWGGRVALIDLVPGSSTTGLLDRINASRRPK